MSVLKEELKKQIAEKLAASVMSRANKEKILANLDKRNEAQLIEILDVLLMHNSPALLKQKKIDLEEKLAALKSGADIEITKLKSYGIL